MKIYTPEEEVIRAGRAREVLENDLFKEAFANIEEAILDGIRRSAFVDALLREKLCAQYSLLHTLRDQLTTFMETGQMAAETIRQQSIAEKVKNLWQRTG